MVDTPFSDSYIESDAELEALIGADPRAAAIALKDLAAASQCWYCQEATRRIDALPLAGRKYDIDITAGVPDQTLAFPRIIDGVTCGWNSSTSLAIVPSDVVRACMEEAIALYLYYSSPSAGKRQELQSQGVTSYSIGKLSETFGHASACQARGIQSQEAYRMLSKYIARSVPIR